ncbi:hypothetical protein Droror1_Dr00019388 [Drosera rotundifolia]
MPMARSKVFPKKPELVFIDSHVNGSACSESPATFALTFDHTNISGRLQPCFRLTDHMIDSSSLSSTDNGILLSGGRRNETYVNVNGDEIGAFNYAV